MMNVKNAKSRLHYWLDVRFLRYKQYAQYAQDLVKKTCSCCMNTALLQEISYSGWFPAGVCIWMIPVQRSCFTIRERHPHRVTSKNIFIPDRPYVSSMMRVVFFLTFWSILTWCCAAVGSINHQRFMSWHFFKVLQWNVTPILHGNIWYFIIDSGNCLSQLFRIFIVCRY